MNQKKCLKCGHTTSYSDAAPLACEHCGAIYKKVEAALSGPPTEASQSTTKPTERPGTQSNQAKRSIFPNQKPDHKQFAETMRGQSLYPTWRELVKWITFFWYGIAVLALVGTAVSAGVSMPTYIAFLAGAVIVIFARATKELSLMLTDLADAAVRIAAEKERL